MRIFHSFLIIICSTILILLPVTDGIYDFRTDLKTDSFTVETVAAQTSANVQLVQALYDNDVSTITITSDDIDDSPLYSSYNTTTRALLMTGLAVSTNRTIEVDYDYDVIYVYTGSAALDTFLNLLPWIWILIWVAFPIAGLAAIWLGKAD